MTAISFDHVTKSYGPVTAVDDLDLTLAAGSITGFVGANGAGKSTALRILLGLTRPDSGRATVNGVPYVDLADPATTVGAFTDPNVFHPGRSGRNALRVLARAGEIADERVTEVLELVELDRHADRRVGTYSLGMRQRLGLAAAVLGDPPVLVLDEPANGLDPLGVHWLRGLLRSFAEEGRTVLVSSHHLAELGQTVDDILIIDRGRLIARGATADLLAEHKSANLEELFLDIINHASQGVRS